MFYYSGVRYNGRNYFPQESNFLFQLSFHYYLKEIASSKTSFDEPVNVILNYKEEDNLIYLEIGELMVKKEESSDTIEFYENWLGTINFNLETHEGSGDLHLFKNLEQGVDLSSEPILTKYLTKVAKCNETVYNYYQNSLKGIIGNMSVGLYVKSTRTVNTRTLTFVNIVRLSTTNLHEIEKLINSNNIKYLELLFVKENGKLEKGKKLNQVINLPKFALEYIKKYELEEAEDIIRNIANDYDGNTLRIIFEMFENFDEYRKKDKQIKWQMRESRKKKAFLENIYEFLKEGYKITDLLNYLLKQRLYWSKDLLFNIPYEEANTLNDYLNICKQYDLKYEKYPQNLSKTHDTILKNIKILSTYSKKEDDFKKAVEKYHDKDIEIDDYIFTAPKNIEDLIKEGNNLHHCIGSYVDNILKGISNIYFMRLKDRSEESLVTVELNSDNELVEFKEIYDKEPDDPEILKALKKFVKIKNV